MPEPLICPECERPCGSPAGLGAHRSRKHGVKGKAPARARDPETAVTRSEAAEARREAREEAARLAQARREAAALRDRTNRDRHATKYIEKLRALVPDDKFDDMADRIRKLVADAPFGEAFIVISPTKGPWFVKAGNVGVIVRGAHEPCIVVDVGSVHT